jgi:hypothetical protein
MVGVRCLDGQAGQFKDDTGKTLADYLRAAAPAEVRNQLDG